MTVAVAWKAGEVEIIDGWRVWYHAETLRWYATRGPGERAASPHRAAILRTIGASPEVDNGVRRTDEQQPERSDI